MPNWVKWLVAAVVVMTLSRIHSHFDILARLRAPLLLSLLALAGLALHMERWRPGDLTSHWSAKAVGVILAIAILGVPFSIYPGRSLSYLLDAYLKTILLGVMVWAVARTPGGLRFMGRAVAVGGIAAAVLAVAVGGGGGRLEGVASYDANDLALVCTMTLPLAVWWALDRTARWRAAALLAVPLLVYVVVQTDSRGGFLGTAAVLLAFLVLSFRDVPDTLKKASVAAVALALIAWPFLPDSYHERVRSMTDDDDYNLTSATGRKEVWKRGWGYALERPLFGVGINNFSVAEGQYSEVSKNLLPGQGWKWSTAHNSFVEVLAECGFIAGAAFALLIFRLIWQLLIEYRPPAMPHPRAPPRLLPPLLGASLVGFAVSGFFLSFAYRDVLYILLGLATAVLMERNAVRAALDPLRVPSRRAAGVPTPADRPGRRRAG